jgi:hypothetical protein
MAFKLSKNEPEEEKPKDGRLVIIDGDLLAYRSSAAVETRYIIAKHKTSGREMRFDNRTDFWGRGKQLGGKLAGINSAKKTSFVKEDFVIEDRFELEPVVNALNIAKMTIQGICKACGSDNYVVYLETEDSTNFRDSVATMQKYKDREGKKPEYLKDVKEYLIKRHKAIIASDDLETDDWLMIKTYEENGIQATLDKDGWQGEGITTYDWVKMKKPFDIPAEGVGKIWKDTKGKVRAYGLKSLCLQMVNGDDVDSIKPTALCEAEFGEVSAYKLLAELETPQQCLTAVIEQYKTWYPAPVKYKHWKTGQALKKDWLEISEEIFALLWMKRSLEDDMTFKKLCDKYGVEYEK